MVRGIKGKSHKGNAVVVGMNVGQYVAQRMRKRNLNSMPFVVPNDLVADPV